MLVYLLHKYANIFEIDISYGKVSHEQMRIVTLTKSLINKVHNIVNSNVHCVSYSQQLTFYLFIHLFMYLRIYNGHIVDNNICEIIKMYIYNVHVID